MNKVKNIYLKYSRTELKAYLKCLTESENIFFYEPVNDYTVLSINSIPNIKSVSFAYGMDQILLDVFRKKLIRCGIDVYEYQLNNYRIHGVMLNGKTIFL